MKKLFLAAAVLALILALAACGKKEEPVDEYALAYSAAGEIIDTGVIKAVCPTGWTSVDAFDLNASDKEAVKDTVIFVKDGASVADNRPYIKIKVHGEGEEAAGPDRSIYPDAADITPFTAGSYTWKGFSASLDGQTFTWAGSESLGYPVEVYLWTHSGEEIHASINDSSVRLILESLTVTTEKKR